MNQEEKSLLRKDLSARLPYGVKCKYDSDDYCFGMITNISKYGVLKFAIKDVYSERIEKKIEDVKPYLFPLSSITEEQEKELCSLIGTYVPGNPCSMYKQLGYRFVKMQRPMEGISIYLCGTVVDWLNAHYFDFRGLIERGLAIDATGLNIY